MTGWNAAGQSHDLDKQLRGSAVPSVIVLSRRRPVRRLARRREPGRCLGPQGELVQRRASYADLSSAELGEADLSGASLGGADLHQALELTQPQLDVALGDARTQLPVGLKRPASWPAAAPPASPGPSPMTG